MDADRRQLLSDLRSQLAYHLHIGITEYIQCGDLRDFLTRDVCFFSPDRGDEYDPQPVAESVEKPAEPKNVTQACADTTSDLTLGDIVTEVGRCQSCPLHHERLVPVAGRGGGRAQLLFVGGWLVGGDSPVSPAGEAGSGDVFGREEDVMLGKMIAAIHLQPEECYVTNIIKCGIGPQSQPRPEHIAVCLSYLRQQIQIIRPRVICAMGPVAVRALLGQKHSLSRLRGRFYPYEVAGQQIQLMPTYHPGYLLRNHEMKSAVWADLQAIEKMLAG
ncbi:MAG: uracil-DNA glycosylase [Desulfobulbaceae bacterium]|uniref:Type-4 uracil-DNA glycosylase n=1 Tax=Candidatus Desulfatifera sulfidica TaxID=2841691 RepID=A0A8J6T9F2_9BACT|nr:uracil-DNA glycosylase [Candidatus Desulfatifera sulfidica]